MGLMGIARFSATKKEATKWENNDITTKILSLKLSATCFCLIRQCFLGTNTDHSRNGKHASFVGHDGFSIDNVFCKNNLFSKFMIQLGFQQQHLVLNVTYSFSSNSRSTRAIFEFQKLSSLLEIAQNI